MSEGIVYVLANPAMPGMVKIGKTGRGVEARINELYTTGVPLPFECAYAARVADMDKVEKAFNNAFGPYRINVKREFFGVEPEQAIGLLDLMKLEDVTPAMQAEAESVDVEAKASAEKFKRDRRPPLNYLEMGIPVGSMLIYEGDGQTTCRVADGRKVSFEGRTLSLSSLTRELRGGAPSSGPSYWMYNGRPLNDIYEETYSEY